MYEMEELEKIFLEHALKVQENQDRMVEQFIEQYPDEPIPEHIIDTFSLPIALASICGEIISLRKESQEEKYPPPIPLS